MIPDWSSCSRRPGGYGSAGRSSDRHGSFRAQARGRDHAPRRQVDLTPRPHPGFHRVGRQPGSGSVTRGGMRGLHAAAASLDCGNSGTTMRLLAGLLAAQKFESELTGDESLARRPMDRVVEPLQRMGARASWPPLRVGGGPTLNGIEYFAPVPSAQVKSAILLAGLYTQGETAVVESVKTRDHTEVMLGAMGAEVQG